MQNSALLRVEIEQIEYSADSMRTKYCSSLGTKVNDDLNGVRDKSGSRSAVRNLHSITY